MAYMNRLYVILHPNQALVGSQLDPQEFARHYQIGTTRYYKGRLIFAEIDGKFRHPYFEIERGLSQLVPHADGSPKATKFICSYRVMEHLEMEAIRGLYLATSDGQVLEINSAPYDKTHKPGFIRTFAEIAPLTMLVLSNWDMPEFARYITTPGNPKGAPWLFFTQIDLDVEDFLTSFERNPFLSAPLPTLHPSKLRDALLEMKRQKDKATKGLSLSSDFEHIPMRRVRHGFMFASQEKSLFFPMPSPEEIESKNLKFYRSMD